MGQIYEILDLDLRLDVFFNAEVVPEPWSKSTFEAFVCLDVVACTVNMSHHTYTQPALDLAVHGVRGKRVQWLRYYEEWVTSSCVGYSQTQDVLIFATFFFTDKIE